MGFVEWDVKTTHKLMLMAWLARYRRYLVPAAVVIAVLVAYLLWFR